MQKSKPMSQCSGSPVWSYSNMLLLWSQGDNKICLGGHREKVFYDYKGGHILSTFWNFLQLIYIYLLVEFGFFYFSEYFRRRLFPEQRKLKVSVTFQADCFLLILYDYSVNPILLLWKSNESWSTAFPGNWMDPPTTDFVRLQPCKTLLAQVTHKHKNKNSASLKCLTTAHLLIQ